MKKTTVITIVAIVATLVISFFIGRCTSTPEIITKTTIDTLFVTKPTPLPNVDVESIKLPIHLYHTDTVVVHDTIYIPVDIVKKTYQESSYKAVISGPKVDKYEPTLDYLEVYNQTTTITEKSKTPLFTPFITGGIPVNNIGFSLGAGVFIKETHGVGIEFTRLNQTNALLLRYSYKFNVKKSN